MRKGEQSHCKSIERFAGSELHDPKQSTLHTCSKQLNSAYLKGKPPLMVLGTAKRRGIALASFDATSRPMLVRIGDPLAFCVSSRKALSVRWSMLHVDRRARAARCFVCSEEVRQWRFAQKTSGWCGFVTCLLQHFQRHYRSHLPHRA